VILLNRSSKIPTVILLPLSL